MKVIDIADEIYRELDRPSTLSVPAIAFWVRSNIGALNSHIHQDFYLNSSLELVRELKDSTIEELGEEEKAIMKKMHMVYHYQTLVTATMSAASLDTVVEIESDDTRVRKINKNEQSKAYSSLKKQEYQELRDLVANYIITKAVPSQVAGDDTIAQSGPLERTKRNGGE